MTLYMSISRIDHLKRAEKWQNFFYHIWYSLMVSISFSTTQICLPTAKWLLHALHESTCNKSIYFMLSTCFNFIYEQKIRFPTWLDHWLVQDGCQIAISTDAGLTVHTDSGFADIKCCLNLVLLWIYNDLLWYWSFWKTCNWKAVLF